MHRNGSSKYLTTVFADLRLSAYKFSGYFNGLRHCMLVALLLLVCSCSNQLESQFPTLAEHAGMDHADFMTYLKSPVWEPKGAAELELDGSDAASSADSNSYGTLISKAGVKDMTVGATVNTATSTYIVRPIFDLALLAQDNLLDWITSSSESSTEINLTTSKNATSDSNRWDMDFSASGSYLGFKASADYHQQNATQQAQSDGTVSVRMVYSNYNSKVNLLVSNFASSYDFSKYMVGTQLTSDQIKSYVNAQYTDGAQGKYISSLIINNKGQYQDPTDPFANIQLLNQMEAMFSELGQQYQAYQADTDISQKIVGNMELLKGYILGAIQTFYANNGDSFVTTIYAMNQAIGSGQLIFDSSSSNSESTWGGGLSASYRGLGFSAGTSADVQYYKQNGWASAFSSMTVAATATPAGIVDTNAWASQIQTMLQSQSSPISVPPVNLPSTIDVTPPDAPGQAKDPSEPPDSCFSSYDDWLKYQNSKKPGGQGQDQEDANEAQAEMERRGAIDLLQLDEAAAANLSEARQVGSSSAELYQNYRKELLKLREMKRLMQPVGLADSNGNGSSNLVRVNNMFVSGFETTPYEMVIPQLRPNLDIPGGSGQLDGFPNVTKLLMVVNQLGELNSYLTFISNYSLSQISDDIAEGYAQFYNTFSDQAFDLVSTQLQQGHDITDQLLASFGVSMFGATGQETASTLYQSFDDIDIYNYIKTLLDTDNAKIWTTAPGGYIPFCFELNGSFAFTGVRAASNVSEYLSISYTLQNVQSPSQNPMDFYTQDTDSIQSPLYPVFIYNGSIGATLVFLQNVGSYQLLYGYQNSYAPWPKQTGSTSFNNITPVAPTWDYLFTSVADPGNSFLPGLNSRNPLIWGYSLNWPNTSQYQKYSFLLVDLGTDSNRTSFRPASNNAYYTYADFRGFYQEYDTSGGLAPYYVRDANSAEVDILSIYPWPTHWSLMLLLPINSSSVGTHFQHYMSYTANLSATDIVQNNSFNFAYNYALTD